MYPQGGYKTQTVVQIANLLGAFQRGQISLRAMRLYFAVLAAVSAREAARRARPFAKRPMQYRMPELARIAGIPEACARRGLRSLERAGLLLSSDSAVELTTFAHPLSVELAGELAGGRSVARPVPLPRPVLRFMARCPRAATITTMLIYCVRGLSLSRTGEVRGRGTAKAAWIAHVGGLSLRTVRGARAELIDCGFIDRDCGSKQWKLNRDGAYFSINLQFDRVPREANKLPLPTSGVQRFAPLLGQNASKIAPPYEDRKTPIGLKDQKTRRGEDAGVEGRADEKPNLKNLLPEDVRKLSRLKLVYQQAVNAGWILDCEASFQNFVAAALRANQADGDSVRIFVAIVKRQLWHHVTLAQEERARQIIRRERDGSRQRSVTRCDENRPQEISTVLAQLATVYSAGASSTV